MKALLQDQVSAHVSPDQSGPEGGTPAATTATAERRRTTAAGLTTAATAIMSSIPYLCYPTLKCISCDIHVQIFADSCTNL